MEIEKSAIAGTLESSDILITVTPLAAGSGLRIDLDSNVLPQYGEAIEQLMRQILQETEYDDLHLKAVDRGALDFTIRARLLTALERADKGEPA